MSAPVRTHIRTWPTAILTALLQHVLARTPAALAHAERGDSALGEDIAGEDEATLGIAKLLYEQNYRSVWEDAPQWARSESLRTARVVLMELRRTRALLADGTSRSADGHGRWTDPSCEALPPVALLRHD